MGTRPWRSSCSARTPAARRRRANRPRPVTPAGPHRWSMIDVPRKRMAISNGAWSGNSAAVNRRWSSYPFRGADVGRHQHRRGGVQVNRHGRNLRISCMWRGVQRAIVVVSLDDRPHLREGSRCPEYYRRRPAATRRSCNRPSCSTNSASSSSVATLGEVHAPANSCRGIPLDPRRTGPSPARTPPRRLAPPVPPHAPLSRRCRSSLRCHLLAGKSGDD